MSTIQAFFETARRLGTRLAWKYGAREYTWSEAAQLVRRTARALLALGVKPGESVSIAGPNRPEWILADLGAMAAGAVPAPIYPTLTAEQAGYVAEHSGAKVAIVQNDAQLQKLRSRRPSMQFLVIEGAASSAMSWDQLLARAGETPESALDERLAALQPRGLATLIYTSGTTGPPKAVMLSHENLLFASRVAQRIAAISPDDVLVSYLPLSHVAEQMITIHGPAVSGAQIWFADALEKAPEVIRAARPTIFFGVPRVWEKMQSRIEEAATSASPLRRALLSWARRSRGALADRIVLSKLRARLGLDRVRFAVTGAAAISLATLEFFDSLGIAILDVWGMSESTAMGTSNLPGARRPGTVGRPSAGVEIRLAPDGEILTRGPHVFLGYYKDEAATREALDRDGWLHTGDVGELDAEGYLRISDRKKDLIITSGGKNISPQNLEGQLRRIPGVALAVVVGDARRHLAALFTLEPRNGRGPEELARDPAVIAEIARGLDAVNGQLASFETIKKFRVLPVQFSVESGELTATMKVKRKVVAQKFAREIEELFQV
ncbi:MAG TPA: AMP-dependent synthetase/ligase [Myxococcales bacterium]